MTLLEDVKKELKGLDYEGYVDPYEIAEEIGAAVEDENIWLGDMRWGQTKGAVLGRGLNGQFEYVMITWYSYSGDSDGPHDAEATEVTPIHISSTEWKKV